MTFDFEEHIVVQFHYLDCVRRRAGVFPDDLRAWDVSESLRYSYPASIVDGVLRYSRLN